MNDGCQRLIQIIEGLQKQVAARIAHGMASFLIVRIWTQLARIAQAMPLAIARAGLPTRQRLPRPYVPRPVKPLSHPYEAWRLVRLPRHETWLVHLMQTAADNYLRILLAEPEMAALAATPRVRRLLRPLCRMLGVTDALPPAPPRPPPPIPLAAPSPVAEAPTSPCPPAPPGPPSRAASPTTTPASHPPDTAIFSPA